MRLAEAALASLLLVTMTSCSSSSDASDDERADEAARTTTTTAPDCTKGRPPDVPDSKILSRSIESSGVTRDYLVYVSDSYTGEESAPVVYTFHGAGSNKEEQLIYSNYGPGAEERGAIVVAPQALNDPTWWSPYGFRGQVDDLDFFADLMEAVNEEFCVDAGKVYASGMSSGGFMSSAIGCKYSDRIAAVGPVTATYFADGACGEATAVPYTYFHGTADPVVNYYGGKPPDAQPGPGHAQWNAQQWADHNGCDPEPTVEELSPEVTHFEWQNCDAPTNFYRINGGGHTWPGAVNVAPLGYTTHEISATDVMWETFDAAVPPPGTD